MFARRVVIAFLASAIPLLSLRAQDSTATITGRVTDSSDVAVAGAEVFVHRGAARSISDSLGRFRLTRVAPGERTIVVRRPGYRSATLTLLLAPGSTRDIGVRLATLPAPLDTIVTEARATSENLRRNGFYQRRKFGFGDFVDRDAISRMRPFDLTSLLRRLPFVDVVERLGRRQVLLQNGRCRPLLYVDGMRVPDLVDIPVELVDGVEVYRRAVEVPVEFTRAGSACGAVIIWTR